MRKAAEHEIGGEGARGVHGCIADWAGPQAGEDDVTTDCNGREGADVLGTRRCTDDRARQAGRKDKLCHHGLPIANPSAGLGCSEAAGLPVDRPKKKTGKNCAGELGNDVAGNAPPGKVSAEAEGERDGGVEMGARDVTHEEDDRHHHQARCRDSCRAADRAVADRTC